MQGAGRLKWAGRTGRGVQSGPRRLGRWGCRAGGTGRAGPGAAPWRGAQWPHGLCRQHCLPASAHPGPLALGALAPLLWTCRGPLPASRGCPGRAEPPAWGQHTGPYARGGAWALSDRNTANVPRRLDPSRKMPPSNTGHLSLRWLALPLWLGDREWPRWGTEAVVGPPGRSGGCPRPGTLCELSHTAAQLPAAAAGTGGLGPGQGSQPGRSWTRPRPHRPLACPLSSEPFRVQWGVGGSRSPRPFRTAGVTAAGGARSVRGWQGCRQWPHTLLSAQLAYLTHLSEGAPSKPAQGGEPPRRACSGRGTPR